MRWLTWLYEEGEIWPDSGTITGRHEPLPHNEVRLRGAVRGESVLSTVFERGKRVTASPSIHDVRRRACDQIASLPDEFRRLRNPEIYRVMLSERIGMLKEEMLSTPDLA